MVIRIALCLTLALATGCVEIGVPDPAVRYVAFGDSTTAGPSSRDYPDILRELLGLPAETFANEGMGGETTDEGLSRLESLLAGDIYPEAEFLLYWEGGNDITDFIQETDPFLFFSPTDADYPFTSALTSKLDQIQANIEAAITAARRNQWDVYVTTYFLMREEINVCDPLPFDILLPEQAQRANEYILLLNDRIRAAAASSRGLLVDVAASAGVISADPDNYFNCNHLSESGNTIVANLFFSAVPLPRN